MTTSTQKISDKIHLYENLFSGKAQSTIEEEEDTFKGAADMSNGSDSSKYIRDEEGLILPKKLINPCIGSREIQNMHREIKWNAKKGVNVLANKSELKIAMEKRNRSRVEVERKFEGEENKTQFQRALEERAKRLDDMEKKQGGDSIDIDSGHCSPEPENEFLKVHAQLKKVRNLP